jgi:hypothetical protein
LLVVALLGALWAADPGAPPAAADGGAIGVDARVERGADDAEEALSTGTVTRSSFDLELVREPDERVDQVVGVRFAGLALPRGAVVQRAWVQFTADEVQSDPTTLTIAAHDVDNAPKLGPNATNLRSRNPTAATVSWSPPPWTRVGDAGAAQRTPDLRDLVQEVVDRPHWVGDGGALAFLFRGTGHRTAVAFDADPSRAPALHVDYVPGTPAPQDPGVRRLAVVGDYGNGGPGEGRVANLVNSLGVDDVLTTGDNSYGANPVDENVGRFYEPYLGGAATDYGTGATTNRFWPTLGNHDLTDGGGLAAYLRYFSLPGNERYYDVLLGPVHVFAVNSNHQEPDGITANSVQARWLRDAVAASPAPWQVVILHHSPFSSGGHGSNPTLQWPFAEWGVDAVFSGHDHDYERHEVDGTPYVVTGLGGVSRDLQRATAPTSVFFTGADDGALVVDACAGRMELSFRTVSSGTLDTRTLGGPTCDLPTVDVSATGPTATEGGDAAVLTVTRTGATNRPLLVRYTVDGTATAGADYAALTGSVTIPAGASSVDLRVEPVDDAAVEDDETVTVRLVDRGDLDVGASGSATVTVRSDDRAPVSVDLHPVGHQRLFGVVQSGNLAALRSSDNQRLVLREQLGNSNPANSMLESRFVLPTIPTHLQLMVVVEAHHSVNGEGDDVLVDWSRNDGPWRTLVTVTKTADNGTAQFKVLPSWIEAGDVVSLRVRDANRTPGRRQLDTASVDRLFLRALVPG